MYAEAARHQPRHGCAGLHKLGFRIGHEGKHTLMSNGRVRLTIPRQRPRRANPLDLLRMPKSRRNL